ncbi:MAG: hypothetical protein WAU33_06795 [Candidatus Binataceae bacterium]
MFAAGALSENSYMPRSWKIIADEIVAACGTDAGFAGCGPLMTEVLELPIEDRRRAWWKLIEAKERTIESIQNPELKRIVREFDSSDPTWGKVQ